MQYEIKQSQHTMTGHSRRNKIKLVAVMILHHTSFCITLCIIVAYKYSIEYDYYNFNDLILWQRSAHVCTKQLWTGRVCVTRSFVTIHAFFFSLAALRSYIYNIYLYNVCIHSFIYNMRKTMRWKGSRCVPNTISFSWAN